MTDIRPQRAGDIRAIRNVVTVAFVGAAYGSDTEAAIVQALRHAGVLTLSPVAERDRLIVGHAAISPGATPAMPFG